jgi:hypothetical protein
MLRSLATWSRSLSSVAPHDGKPGYPTDVGQHLTSTGHPHGLSHSVVFVTIFLSARTADRPSLPHTLNGLIALLYRSSACYGFLDPLMTSELLPRWQSALPPIRGHGFPCCGAFFRRNGIFTTVIFSAFLIIGQICYITLTPHDTPLIRPLDWYGLSQARPNHTQLECVHADPSVFPSATHAYPSPTSTGIPPEPPSPPPASAELTLEQIRDIVAHTRGFFSRDYSLHLGWNNVSINWDYIS